MLAFAHSTLGRSCAVLHHAHRPAAVRLMSSADGYTFDKIMVANRGEIACRVIETAKRMGIQTVAVYSDADVNAKHVALADEAYRLGPPAAAESYLLADKILAIAKECGAQAIHPGYGFLSENQGFAQACADNGVTFIGPPPSAIRDMGSKSASKDIMIAAGVPVTPGYHGEDQNLDTLQAEADGMGYPVLVKAVMGGGGKGMRIVRSAKELKEGVKACQREARASFGDDRVLIERYLEKPRHVELQVFADTHGNAVHLFERDCSVQRRHQKVLEEAPAPHMSEEVRQRMGDSAVAAAKAVGYVGAGTVEFMLDEDDSYYFMEMNTRLQVEHPVTELITGQDLVSWQLQVAAGHPLPKAQHELAINGHALEARIYAENPEKDFLPQTGHLAHLTPPAQSRFVRVDTGVREGDTVSVFYDPMISKLITWGADRGQALRHMTRALEQYKVVGLDTNINFLKTAVNHSAFAAGGVDTSFLEKHLDEVLPAPKPVPTSARALAAIGLVLAQQAEAAAVASASLDRTSPWGSGNGSRPAAAAATRSLTFADRGDEVDVLVTRSGDRFTVQVDGQELSGTASLSDGELVAFVDGSKYSASIVLHDNAVHLFTGSAFEAPSYVLDVPVGQFGSAAGGGSGNVVTPMPGKVIKMEIAAGTEVKEGDELLILEAMKMEHVIRAPRDGVVKAVNCALDSFVEDGTVLVQFEEEA